MMTYNAGSTTDSYTYRNDGSRAKSVKTEGSSSTRTEHIYDGQMPVCEQDFEDGVLKQTRIHLLGARGIEGIITLPATGSSTLNWLFYDGHGNMVRTMSTSFALSGFQWQGVWGERTNSTPGRGYCANLGHPEDETGLVYMRARYYEPGTGRFISEDPARDGVNWYLYADGDPVGKVDADGKESEWDRNWHAFLNFLSILASALIGAGVSLFVAGSAMIKAAEAAFKSLQAQGAVILLVQGMKLKRAGVYSIVAGAVFAFIVWFGYGMTEEEYREWKDTLGMMYRFGAELVYRGWHPETWGQPI